MCDKQLTVIPDHDTYFQTLIAAKDFGTCLESIVRRQNASLRVLLEEAIGD